MARKIPAKYKIEISMEIAELIRGAEITQIGWSGKENEIH